jgi:cytochrome c oxidase subunit 2
VIQNMVWDISILLMGSLAAVFVGVAAGAQVPLVNYGPAIASAYRLRLWLFVLALIILIGANYRALGDLPYISNPAAQSAVAMKRVDATGEQWSWTVTPASFVVGQTAEFYVTSKDVNHGFGLYDPHMHIVAQTQAMPGYTNVLRYTFREPGTYQVLCLEYCGLVHHEMRTEITVAAR